MVNVNVEVNTVVSHQPGPILESIMLNCQTFQISGLKYTTIQQNFIYLGYKSN